MSSSAGLSSYSSLFASGLHPSGRFQAAAAATSKDVYAYPFQRIPYASKDSPSNINFRRPSADTESSSTASRRSSLPTFASGRRMGQNNSFYAPNQQPAAVASPSATASTPSTPLRSEPTATKRSNFKSFLSMDANDPTQQPAVPLLPPNYTPPPRASQNKRSRGRAVSDSSSSVWAASMLQPPRVSNYSLNFDGDRHSTGAIGGNPPRSEAYSIRRSTSAPLPGDQRRTSFQQNKSAQLSDKPPRLEIRLDPRASRISFDPSSPDGTTIAALISGAPQTSSPSIPVRPKYEPRVRSSLMASSITSAPPPVPKRSPERNMSVTSASTFVSATPSQRSVIRRTRRNEALARLEGSYYDPAPEVQASASFMPFESDEEEEEESEVDPSSRRDVSSSQANSSPPPLIKPPSPLRHRNIEQHRFVEIEATESLFELALTSIAEVPVPLTPRPDTRVSFDGQGPLISVHQSMWASFEDEDEENITPSVSSHHHHMVPMTLLAASPLSSDTKLSIHSANKSSTSLASFTPFSSTDFNRARTGSIHLNTHDTGSGSQHTTSARLKPNSGRGSIVTRDSLSIRSKDATSDESLVRGIGPIVRSMDPLAGSRRRHDRSRDRSGSASRATPHYLKAAELKPVVPSDTRRSSWMHGLSSAVTPTTPKTSKPSKHGEKRAKSKDAKAKEGMIRYETYLDMSGDEKHEDDGALKKRRWPFGK